MKQNIVCPFQKLFVLNFLVFLLLFASTMEAQESIDSAQLKVSKTVIPIAFFLPETSFAFGGTGILSLRNTAAIEGERPSQVLLGAIYSLKNQLLLIANFEIYQKQRAIRYRGELGYFIYFYNFYGLGSDSSIDDLEVYDVTFPRIDFNYARRVYRNISVGTGLKYDRFNITRIDEDGLLNTTRPIGYNGGTKFNLQTVLFYDTRNNINSSKNGLYLELTYQKSLDFLLSSFNSQKFDIDFRYFKEFKKEWVMAHQFWLATSSSGTPFFDQANISTSVRSRGFDDRRFINRHMASVQSELRFPLFWRIKGTAFYSYTVIPDSLSKPFADDEKFTYGAGLRILLNEKDRTFFRIDIAKGEEKINFYLTANEAF